MSFLILIIYLIIKKYASVCFPIKSFEMLLLYLVASLTSIKCNFLLIIVIDTACLIPMRVPLINVMLQSVLNFYDLIAHVTGPCGETIVTNAV